LTFFLAENLADLGPEYEIESCNSGTEALMMLHKAPTFDLIITDLMMPDISGLQIVRLLKEQQLPTKVILMTAHGNEETALKAKKLGVTSYIAKPFEIEEMLTTICEVLAPSATTHGEQPANGSNSVNYPPTSYSVI
jgi:CheY-like chemotaxis protein